MQPVLWKAELLQLMSHLLQILHSKDEDESNKRLDSSCRDLCKEILTLCFWDFSAYGAGLGTLPGKHFCFLVLYAQMRVKKLV